MKILITGVAGFIGMHVAFRYLSEGHDVTGVDSLDDYYDPILKISRLNQLWKFQNFVFLWLDICDDELHSDAVSKDFDVVINLAAQAGVRYSIENPMAYARSNLLGFTNVLEYCRRNKVGHLVYASSSSVYGSSLNECFSEKDRVDSPVSFYAATKKANELMAYSYSHLYGLATTGLRFFTVYGPWGRPDMAAFLFTKAIVNGEAVDVFNAGEMKRDFTYIDDIVTGLVKVGSKIPKSSSGVPALVFNVGNNSPVLLLNFIEEIERSVGRRAIKNFLPMQPGDVPSTCADIAALSDWVGFTPATPLSVGVAKFVHWYRSYYNL